MLYFFVIKIFYLFFFKPRQSQKGGDFNAAGHTFFVKEDDKNHQFSK